MSLENPRADTEEHLLHGILCALFQVFLRLGCPEQLCRDGVKGAYGSTLHATAEQLLWDLCCLNRSAVKHHLQMFVEHLPASTSLQLLHSLLLHCSQVKPKLSNIASSAMATEARPTAADRPHHNSATATSSSRSHKSQETPAKPQVHCLPFLEGEGFLARTQRSFRKLSSTRDLGKLLFSK